MIDFVRSRFAACVCVAALLAACGTLQPPIATHDTAAVTPGFSHYRFFSYTGGKKTFKIPAGVSHLKITLYGANGGLGNYSCCSGFASGGGAGGTVTATIPVTPGESLAIFVGVLVAGGGGGGAADGYDGGASGGGTSDGGTGGQWRRAQGSDRATAGSDELAGGGGGGATQSRGRRRAAQAPGGSGCNGSAGTLGAGGAGGPVAEAAAQPAAAAGAATTAAAAAARAEIHTASESRVRRRRGAADRPMYRAARDARQDDGRWEPHRLMATERSSYFGEGSLMKTSAAVRFALNIGIAAAVLAGCDASPPTRRARRDTARPAQAGFAPMAASLG
jgi:hypothetical protein